MDNLKELIKSGEERFKQVSVSHDQKGKRERMKEVKKKTSVTCIYYVGLIVAYGPIR